MSALLEVREQVRCWEFAPSAQPRFTELVNQLRRSAASGDDPAHVVELYDKGPRYLARLALVVAEAWAVHDGQVGQDTVILGDHLDWALQVFNYFVAQRRCLTPSEPNLMVAPALRDQDRAVVQLLEKLTRPPNRPDDRARRPKGSRRRDQNSRRSPSADDPVRRDLPGLLGA